MTIYTVREGEGIVDVVINSTGSIDNWGIICDYNNFTDWTQQLTAGQQVIIPDTVIEQPNVLAQLNYYPICNNSVPNILEMIESLSNLLNNRGIGSMIIETDFIVE